MYLVRTCAGLCAIARESMKDWNRETAGTLWGKVTPRYPTASEEKHDPGFPTVSGAVDDVGQPASSWDVAGRECHIPRRSASRSGSAQHSECGKQKGTDDGRYGG